MEKYIFCAVVTVNKYSRKKVLPDYFITSEKVLPLYLLPREKVLPLEKKMLPYPEILAACFSQYFWEKTSALRLVINRKAKT